LKRIVNDETRLPSHRVVDSKKAGAVWDGLDDGLYALLELLVVEARGRADGRLVLLPDSGHRPSKAQATELLGCSLDAEKLLLQGPLPLGQIRIRGDQFIVHVLIHVLTHFSVNLNLRRCKYVFWK
jgi:hypothetical protein